MNWHKRWFNEDYLFLYASRNEKEAARQVDFISRHLQLKPNEKLIDVGCGKGRHAFLFAKMGLLVVGVDQSETLIRVANERLQKENLPNLSFIESEIETFHSKEPFDIAINVFTSFGYLKEHSENLSILKAIRAHLKEGSRFFFDYLNPVFVEKHLVPDEKKIIDGKTVHIKRWIERGSIFKEIHFSDQCYQERVNLYDRVQLEDFHQKAGFEIRQRWGSYEGEKLDETSERQLFFLRAV